MKSGAQPAPLATAEPKRSRPPRAALALALLLSFAGAPPVARADLQHTVREGQNLARIARRYGVAVPNLAAANGLSTRAPLRPGQVLVVPSRGVVYVRPGQTLAAIARRHQVTAAQLAKQNRLRPDAVLRVGQRLLLPGFEAAEVEASAEKRWGRPKRPGTATFFRIKTEETRRVRLVDRRGRVRADAVRKLRHLMRPRDSRKRIDPHRRLLRLLAQVSDHFGGRQIQIVSGYRRPGGYTKKSSRHVAGHAIDFRVRGVPLKVLRDYCASFERVGVGFYPRSKFVHLDVRRKNARWTDWSRPGEAPMRRRPTSGGPKPPETEAELSSEPPAEDDGLSPLDDPQDASQDASQDQ
ncbi:MAG: LysM peptidoglycan-binding domain-containing protein [Myxococcales bacterium]|nr:LysM peptidoglycan-binding domain-containing protein [Myxococcales bacterium]